MAAAMAGALSVQRLSASRVPTGARLAPRLAAPRTGRSSAPQPARRQQRGGEPARAATPAAAAAAAAATLSPALVFDLATVLVMPFYLAMIFAPRKPLTRQLLGWRPLAALGGALYALLLAAWRPLPALAAVVRPAAAAVQAAAAGAGAAGAAASLRAALPSLPVFGALFSSPEITIVAWVHLLLLDLLQARWVHQDGLRSNVPTWHSAVLCFMVGPLGLLCHLATKAALGRLRGGGQQEEYVVYRF